MGSVIIQTQITIDGKGSIILEQMKEKLREFMLTKDIDFGGPVLGYGFEQEEMIVI